MSFPSRPGALFAAPLILLILWTAGCTVRLIAEHDEVLVQKTVLLQERAELLFLRLEEAAATADPADGALAAHAEAYRDILVLARLLEVRAAALPQNELTQQQVALLRDSFERMRNLHATNSGAQPPREFSFDLIQALRGPFVQQVTSILTLQHALRRGA